MVGSAPLVFTGWTGHAGLQGWGHGGLGWGHSPVPPRGHQHELWVVLWQLEREE